MATSLLERLRNCKSCAERRALMRQYGRMAGGLATRQFDRLRSAARQQKNRK